jgi:hypothetical protein
MRMPRLAIRLTLVTLLAARTSGQDGVAPAPSIEPE